MASDSPNFNPLSCAILQLRGMNAVFGLKTTITLGETLVVGVATGTAVLLDFLPHPTITGMLHSNQFLTLSRPGSLTPKFSILRPPPPGLVRLKEQAFGASLWV